MIVVLNEGRITGVGSHEELLATNQEYKEIYDSQMSDAARTTNGTTTDGATTGSEVRA